MIASGPASARPFSFLSQPTDQLGVPGYVAGTEVTPSGSLYTGWAELEFRFGARLQATDGTNRSLLDGRSPVVRYVMSSGGVRYTVTVLCAAVGHRPVNFVRVVLKNQTRRPAAAAWEAGLVYSGAVGQGGSPPAFRFNRPAEPRQEGQYAQPGAVFDPGSVWAFTGRAVTRDGGALLLFPAAPRDATRRLILRPGQPGQPGQPGDPVTEQSEFGRVQYRLRLAPASERELDFTMPVIPVAPQTPDYAAIAHTAFSTALTQALAYWHGLYAQAIGIQVPEAKVDDAFYTSLANLAMSRYPSATSGWVQTVNKLQYNAFWLRDAAFIANAFDLAGLSRLAAQDLDFFPVWQQPDGLFISQPQQYDGLGEALWAIGHHAEMTHDRAFAEQMLGAVERAVSWFEAEREADSLGLMPLSTPHDNELTTGHITGDDFLAADGLRGAIAVAELLHRDDLATRWKADLESFTADLSGHLAAAEAKTGGWIPPDVEANGGQDWGNLWASYPEPVLPAGDPAVTATLRHVISRFRQGIATYFNGSLLHGYLGFRVFETELLRGQQAAVVTGLYAELAHTTATNGGFEMAAGRVIPGDLAPHGWFAAEYVSLLRNMLVREDGHGLVLMGAISPSWLRPGDRIVVSHARTSRGQIAYTLQGHPGGAVLTWHAMVIPGTRLRWPVPAAAKNVRAAGLSRDGRTITLRGAAGRLVVHWRLAGPSPSFAATARRVLASYPR